MPLTDGEPEPIDPSDLRLRMARLYLSLIAPEEMIESIHTIHLEINQENKDDYQ